MTVYHVAGPSSGLDQLIDVEADRFKNLEFGEETFQTEAKAVLGEYNKNASHPSLKIEETVLATAFKSHTYRHTTLGFLEDIKEMPSKYEYSKQFFKRWYTPDNVMLFIVGDFDDAKLMEQIEKRYGAWAGKAATLEVPAEPAQDAPRTATVTWTLPSLKGLASGLASPLSRPRAATTAAPAPRTTMTSQSQRFFFMKNLNVLRKGPMGRCSIPTSVMGPVLKPAPTVYANYPDLFGLGSASNRGR